MDVVMRGIWVRTRCVIGRAAGRVRAFFAESRAVSTVEYALIVVAVIAIVGVGAGMLSGAFKGLFTELTDTMADAPGEVTTKASGGTPSSST